MRAGVHQKPYMSLEVEVAGAALVGGTWASIRPRPASKCMPGRRGRRRRRAFARRREPAEHASLCSRVLFQRTMRLLVSVSILVSCCAREYRRVVPEQPRGASPARSSPSALINARELLPARLCVRRAAPAAVGAWRSATAAQRHSRHDGQEGRCEEGRCHHRCPALHSHGRMRLHRLAPASLSSPHPLPVSPSPPSQ